VAYSDNDNMLLIQIHEQPRLSRTTQERVSENVLYTFVGTVFLSVSAGNDYCSQRCAAL